MKLNGFIIPTPNQSLKVDPIEYSAKNITASGRNVKDIKVIKNNYVLSYQGLSPATMKIFKDAYYAGNSVPFEYEDGDDAPIIKVYINSLPYSISKLNPKLSQNVTITLEEV